MKVRKMPKVQGQYHELCEYEYLIDKIKFKMKTIEGNTDTLREKFDNKEDIRVGLDWIYECYRELIKLVDIEISPLINNKDEMYECYEDENYEEEQQRRRDCGEELLPPYVEEE